MDTIIYVVVVVKERHIAQTYKRMVVVTAQVPPIQDVVQVTFIVLLIIPMGLVQEKPVVPVKFPI